MKKILLFFFLCCLSLRAADLTLPPSTPITGATIEADDNVYSKTAHGITTGQGLVLNSLSGGTGLTASRSYWFHKLTDNTGYLCTTKADAVAGTAVNVTVDATSVSVSKFTRIVAAGDSLIYNRPNPSFPDYIYAYLALRNPTVNLRFETWARSGIGIAGLFDGSGAGNEHYSKHIFPLQPDHVIIEFADNGGYDGATELAHMTTLIDDYVVGDSYALPIMVGMIPQSNVLGYALGSTYDNNHQTLAEAETPAYLYFKTWQALDDIWLEKFTVTANSGTDVWTATGHNFSNGDAVLFMNGTAPGGTSNNTQYFVRDVSGHTFKLASTLGGAAIDISTNGSGTIYISRTWPLLRADDDITDDVHPSAAGSVSAAWKIITGLGWGVDVSAATIAANTLSVTSETQCDVASVTANAYGGINFTRLDNRLPWAFDESARVDVLELYPAFANWQTYTLTVTGLSAGTYDVIINGVDVADVTHTTLASGWNMADLTTGPVYDKCHLVLDLIRDVQGFDPDTLQLLSPAEGFDVYYSNATQQHDTNGLTGNALIAALDTFITELNTRNAAVTAAAQPETLTFSIRRQGEWNYSGIPYTDWAYDPFLISRPTQPAAWPAAEQAGYYFIEQGHASASDTADGSDTLDANGKRYGYPNRPRVTIPAANQYYTQYAAGAVIWIKGHSGEVYDATSAGFSTWGQASQGTSANPVWIVGDPDVPPVFSNLRMGLYSLADMSQSAKYVIVDGIEWGPWTVHGGCVSFDPGVHHITVRNCNIHDRDAPPSGGGSFFSIGNTSTTVAMGHTATEYDTHDIVIYSNTFTDNGHGIDWRSGDPDFHGVKGSSRLDAGRVYRIWVIDNAATGTFPDPVDSITKSICGSFTQWGDDVAGLGNVDHVFIAGNHTDYIRQSIVGMKRCKHIFASSNVSLADSLWATFASCFNIKYGTQEGMWVINNYVANQPGALVGRKELDSGESGDTALIGIIGNVAHDCTFCYEDGALSGWRENGIAFQEHRGTSYVVNNTLDNTTYGVVTAVRPSTIATNSQLHIYNNAFVNMVPGNDPLGGKSITISELNGSTGDMSVFMENNLADDLQVYIDGQGTITSAATLNALAYAENNLEIEAGFTDEAGNDYTLTLGGAAVGAGVSGTYTTNAADDVYDLFIATYDSDPDFPGDPADVWPYDRAGTARPQGGSWDIGAYEFTSGVEDGTVIISGSGTTSFSGAGSTSFTAP